MSQQGIFSIASGGQADDPSSVNSGENGSPFSVVSDDSAQGSPFAGNGQVGQGESPFQRGQGQQETSSDFDQGVIPAPRPEGQHSSFGATASGSRMVDESSQAANVSSEATVVDASQGDGRQQAAAGGEAFQMNGFSQQTGNEVMEAAPVATSHEASPFMAVEDDHNNYEAAKANLEPQQDFAAVPSTFTPALDAPASPAPVTTPPPTPAPPVQQPAPPQQQAQAVSPVQQAPVTPAINASAAPELQQLELRAIFGVDHLLDVNEILQRARTLPGIRNVAVVGDQQAQALSNFRHAIEGMGLGDSNQMQLNSSGGSVEFISEGNSTLAVLLEGSYAPGVKETLIIVAREIGKLA